MSGRNSMFVFSSNGRKSPPMKATSSLIQQPTKITNKHYQPHPISQAIPETNTSINEDDSFDSTLNSIADPIADATSTQYPLFTKLSGPPRLPGFPLMKSSSVSTIRQRARKSIASSNHSNATNQSNSKSHHHNHTKEQRKNTRYGYQAVELERLRRENALLNKKLFSTEKRCQYLQDSRKELQAVASTNHLASIQAESSASRHSAISSTLAVKYKNVQKVLNLVREEYDTMIQETEQQRVEQLHISGSIDEISSNIRQMIVYDTICILKIFQLK